MLEFAKQLVLDMADVDRIYLVEEDEFLIIEEPIDWHKEHTRIAHVYFDNVGYDFDNVQDLLLFLMDGNLHDFEPVILKKIVNRFKDCYTIKELKERFEDDYITKPSLMTEIGIDIHFFCRVKSHRMREDGFNFFFSHADAERFIKNNKDKLSNPTISSQYLKGNGHLKRLINLIKEVGSND